MKKTVAILFCIGTTALAIASETNAGMFDAVKSVSSTPSSSGSLGKQEFDAFFEISKKADSLMNKSLDNVSKMLLNKDDSEKIERQKKELDSIKDPKEHEAAFNKIIQDQSASVAKALEQKDATQKLKSLSSDQQKLAGDSIYNLFLSGLKNKSALEVATGITQKAKANPMAVASYASEMSRIKDAIAVLPSKADKTLTLGNNLVKLAKNAGITPTLPKSATDEAKEVAVF